MYMVFDYSTLPHAGIQGLHPYIPGKTSEALRAEKQLSHIIKLASNENPLGCSQEVFKQFAQINRDDVATYPITQEHPLRLKIAAMHGLDKNHVILGNGSDMLFHLLLTCFALHTGKHVLTHDYAFMAYEVQANTLGIPIRKVPLDMGWEVNIDVLIQACHEKTALIFLANPNNPTGLFIHPEKIEQLLANIPESTILVLDEAYHEYVPAALQLNTTAWLNKYPNLVITRTFSKVYGLAALRLGYAFGHPSIIELLHRIQLPFTVSQPSLLAGMRALDDQAFVKKSVTMNAEGLCQVKASLDHLGLTSIPSMANFLTFDCGCDALQLDHHLQSRGIIIRPLNPYGLTQHLRVTIGTFEQNTQFINALTMALKETTI